MEVWARNAYKAGMANSTRYRPLCRRCRNSTEVKRVEHPYWHGTQLVALIRDVPAHVCTSCGYHHFDTAVETRMEGIVQDYIRMGALFPIPSTIYRDAAGLVKK